MTIIELHHKLASLRLVYGTSGNASIIDRGPYNYIKIKASGIRCDEVSISNIICVPSDNSPYSLDRSLQYKPSTDLPLHRAIYDVNLKISCVIHTHSIFAAAFSVLGDFLPTYVTGTAELFGARVPCIPYQADREATADAIKYIAPNHNACLLERHGALVWHETPEQALHLAEALEWSCHIALLHGASTGSPMNIDDVMQYKNWYRSNYGQRDTPQEPSIGSSNYNK